MTKLAILSAKVIPVLFDEGNQSVNFLVNKLPLSAARQIARHNEVTSYIGHEAMSRVASTLLEQEIPVNRAECNLEPGQQALVIRPLGRLPEGKIMTEQELLEVGIEFLLITRNY